jgi:hypothetical protein
MSGPTHARLQPPCCPFVARPLRAHRRRARMAPSAQGRVAPAWSPRPRVALGPPPPSESVIAPLLSARVPTHPRLTCRRARALGHLPTALAGLLGSSAAVGTDAPCACVRGAAPLRSATARCAPVAAGVRSPTPCSCPVLPRAIFPRRPQPRLTPRPWQAGEGAASQRARAAIVAPARRPWPRPHRARSFAAPCCLPSFRPAVGGGARAKRAP